MKVRSWLDTVGDVYISKKDLGDSLDSAYSLQEECLNIEAQLMVSYLLCLSTSRLYISHCVTSPPQKHRQHGERFVNFITFFLRMCLTQLVVK